MPLRVRMLLSGMLAMLLVFGSSGDTQVPPDILPPTHVVSPEDYGALRESLVSISELWAIPGVNVEIHDVRFRPMLQTSSVCVYTGSYGLLVSAPGFWNSTLLVQSSMEPHDFAYVHELGQQCATPPDLVFDAVTPRRAVRPFAKNSIRTPNQLSYLVFLLQLLESGDPASWLAPIPVPCANNSQALINFAVSGFGATYAVELSFRDAFDPDGTVTKYRVEASWNGSDFNVVSVQ